MNIPDLDGDFEAETRARDELREAPDRERRLALLSGIMDWTQDYDTAKALLEEGWVLRAGNGIETTVAAMREVTYWRTGLRS